MPLTATQLALAESWPGATNVRACTVKIGRSTYEGFSYEVPPGWGTSDGTPQPSWGETRFYLLADTLPPSHDRAYYKIAGDDADWFFGGYVTPEVAADPQYAECHPLGAHFLLMRWDHERLGQRIDQWDIGRNGRTNRKQRMPIEVTYA